MPLALLRGDGRIYLRYLRRDPQCLGDQELRQHRESRRIIEPAEHRRILREQRRISQRDGLLGHRSIERTVEDSFQVE